ncbi:hypothetical protein F5144DRAFT_392173 [Chaetomium tenue]|uniref:Uncharacterized protein n=1 Tax=Chaetomium tenue TaxID=1854479 RepID=A0ACB7NVV6_9PEZI|nr:hypothetical protein F5144DRAFT_392173 [Chaetomium globosum]
MCYIGDGQTAGVRFYGARELHATGEPHYHVLMAFEKRVHWRDARARLAVMIDVEVDGKTVQEVDTESIRVKTPKKTESLSWFLDCCHAYICKEGNDHVFGEWIESNVEVNARKQDKVLRRLVEEPYRDECVKLLRQYFPKDFIFRYPRGWLATKKSQRAGGYIPKFERNSWRIPAALRHWFQANVVGPVEGLPKDNAHCVFPVLGGPTSNKDFDLPG